MAEISDLYREQNYAHFTQNFEIDKPKLSESNGKRSVSNLEFYKW